MTTIVSSRRLSRNALAHLLMLAIVAIWGMTFVLVKHALRDIPPQVFNTLRMALAFALLAIVYRSQWRRLTPEAWVSGATAGVCIAAGYFFQTAGLVYTTPTNSAFITGLVVVIVPFLATVPGLRAAGIGAPGWNAWLGAGLAFLGVALLTTPTHTRWGLLLHTLNRGDVLTFGCALAFSMHVIVLSRVTQRVPYEQIALLQIGFAALFLAIAAEAIQHPAPSSPIHPIQWSWLVLFAILITGILATAVAFSVQTWAQQIVPATNIAVILALEPVFAWLTAFAMLQERLQLRRAIGAVMVLAGILATELVRRRGAVDRTAVSETARPASVSKSK